MALGRSLAWGSPALSLLTINAGSSTLKAALFDDGAAREIASVTVEGAPEDVAASLSEALRSLSAKASAGAGEADIRAVGHRVVHGGTELRESIRIDEPVKEAIRRASELAPLHNPPALAAIEVAQQRFQGVPHVAAFDTAFFSSLPAKASVYPLPYDWYEEWGIRRFGFHGLSHAYCSARAEEMLSRHPTRAKTAPRVIVLHLGNGCSASAVAGGKPVATTMGFTPLEGLMMGTRAGSVDPGILLHALQRRGIDAASLAEILHHQSGLRGVSGLSGDFREAESAAATGDERARLAIEIYTERARGAVGSLAVTMGGVDALVFTAGVGENAWDLRRHVCDGLECLGLILDRTLNGSADPDADIAVQDSPGRILIVRTREDLVLAREVVRVLSGRC